MATYIDRIVDSETSDALATAKALVLRGTRAVGKSESARQHAKSELRLNLSDPRALLAREQPATAIPGATPRLLDEWQLVPGLWNEVRHEVDRRQEPGQFILSGSAAPEDDELMHSGAGWFRQVYMRTMTLAESGESSGDVSLASLLKGEAPAVAESRADFHQVVERIVVGGWPGWLGVAEPAARAQALSYVEEIATHDFVQTAGTRRDPRRFTAYLRAMAELVAQPAPMTTAARRMRDGSNVTVGEKAVPELHALAERMYLVEDQPAWSPQLRSRSTAMQTPKRHLADPSLAAALMGAGVDRLLLEPETLGFLFESQAVHDLRVYAQSLGARGVFHYRDFKGRDEIDVVVEGADGSWTGFEMKLGMGADDAAAANLIRVAEKMKRPPVALVVVTPSGVAHERLDGVFVAPLATLGP